jgi:hypothetical protein
MYIFELQTYKTYYLENLVAPGIESGHLDL